MSAPVGSRSVLLARVAAGASVGSLAAVVAIVVTRTITDPRLVDGTALVITAFCVLAAAVLTAQADEAQPVRVQPSYAGPTPRPAPVRPAPIPPPPGLGPRSAPAQLPSAPGPTPRLRAPAPLAPTPTPASRPTWYDAAARGIAGQAGVVAPAAPSALGPGPTPEPSGSSGPRHVEIALGPAPEAGIGVRQIVQCPRCGAFAVDGRRVRRGCALTCTGCGHTWHIAFDAPWPVTVVRPRLTQSRPGVPDQNAQPVWRLNG